MEWQQSGGEMKTEVKDPRPTEVEEIERELDGAEEEVVGEKVEVEGKR
jgi:hypothetical protein